jgi:hypothetical protein
MKSTILGLGVSCVMAIGCASAQPVKPADGAAAQPQAPGAAVRLSATMLAVWQSPKPPADAKHKTTAGGERTKVNTANSKDDFDSFWIQSIDVDGDGTVETAELLYDDEDRVLYVYSNHTFPCKGGGTGSGEMLIAVNAKDNPRRRPAGSGWYVVALDAGECGAKLDGLYGCHFDTKGNPTDCGSATLDEKNDEVILTAAD